MMGFAMKKLLWIIIISVGATYSQNLQVHYDLGEERKYFTTTLEMFKPDEYGSTFFFVDLDYDFPESHSISLAYFEFARYFTVYKQISFTIQYNDGIVVSKGESNNNGFTLNQSWLAGLSYPFDLGFLILNTDLLFKKIYNSQAPDGQITFFWLLTLLEGQLTFNGFIDVWSQDKSIRAQSPSEDQKEVVFLAEPQVWYNIIQHVSIGTEIELSNNFLPYQDEIKINPTVAVKWNF
jgi:hypothetical protein